MPTAKTPKLFLLSMLMLLLYCSGSLERAPSSVKAQAATESAIALEWLGSFGGQTQGIQLDGDMVYVSLGERVVGLDFSDPESVEIAWALPARPSMLLLRGRTLMLLSERGIELVDVGESPPKRGAWIPVEAIGGAGASLNVIPYGLPQVSGDRVALDAGLGIAVLRFDEDGEWIREAFFPSPRWGRSYALAGDRLFLGSMGAGPILIYELSDPGGPRLLGTIPFGAANGIVATDQDRVLAVGHKTRALPNDMRWLYAFDVSEPVDPRLLWEWDSGPVLIKGLRLGAYGGQAWLHESIPAKSWTVDASDPDGPVFGQPIHENLVPMAAQGDRVAAAVSLLGLRLFEQQPAGDYKELGHYEEPTSIELPRSAGGLIAALGVGEGMGLIDVQDLERPKQLGSLPVPVFESRNDLPFGGVPLGRFMDASSTHVSLSWGWDLAQAGRLWTADITDPNAPQALELADIGAPFGVHQSGSRSYVPLRFGGVSIHDSANTRQPRLLGTSGPGPSTSAVVTLDDTILFGGSTYHLGAYDISDPANAQALDFSHRGHPHALAEGGDMLYAPGNYPPLGMPWNGILPSILAADGGPRGAVSVEPTVRESVISSISSSDHFTAPRDPQGAEREDEPRPQLTATQFPTGVNPALVIVDISTPEAPQIRAQLPLRGSLQYQVSVHEDLLLLGGFGPLEAFDLSTPDAPAPLHWATPDGAAQHQYWTDDARQLITHGDLLVRSGNGLQFFRPYRHEIEVAATMTPSPSATRASTSTSTPTPIPSLPSAAPPGQPTLYLPFLVSRHESP